MTTEKDINVIAEMLPINVSDNILLMVQEREALKARHEKEDKTSHAELWAAVHEQYPLLEQDANYSIDATYASAGVARRLDRQSPRPLKVLHRPRQRPASC